jgi:hypothetical protein
MADKIVHQGLVPSCSQYTMIVLILFSHCNHRDSSCLS